MPARNRLDRRIGAGLAVLFAAAATASAQAPAPGKPLSQDELLRQIESLSPAATDPGRRTPAVMPVPGAAARGGKSSANATSANGPSLFPGSPAESPIPAPKPEKKDKGPTEILALEATFDQKTHIAVFIGQVVVTDPEFNVRADRLTAYLKHEEKQDPAVAAPTARLSATPAPAERKGDGPPSKGGGLDKAIAEANPGGIVTVTQEKTEADGSVTHSIGHGKKVHYDAMTGDITLYGKPDVQQGINTCIATDEATVMTLNRSGQMRVNGAHKTMIRDQSELGK